MKSAAAKPAADGACNLLPGFKAVPIVQNLCVPATCLVAAWYDGHACWLPSNRFESFFLREGAHKCSFVLWQTLDMLLLHSN
jgi:hypothetical protein